jgi:lysophospholipase L1-like esterase
MRMRVLAGFRLVLLSILWIPPAALAQAEITWRVQNPFRLFLDAADTELHRLAYESLSDAERTAPILNGERALSSRFPKGWAEGVYRKVCWDETTNRYACKGRPDYLAPTSHDVVAELKNFDTTDRECEWRLTPLGTRRSAVPKILSAPCAEPMVLNIPYPGGARVSVRIDGPPIAETDISVKDLFVVGMGDSFASGEGNPDDPVSFSRERAMEYGKGPRGITLAGYPARVGGWSRIGDADFVKQNARWLDQACHRSLYSHQLRVALQLAIENPHRSVTYAGFACSGAEIIDGMFLVYRGNEWVPNPPDKSQLSSAANAQCGRSRAEQQTIAMTYEMGGELPMLKDWFVDVCPAARSRKIDLVLLSIGGNDVGFARLVANAVLSDKSTLRRLGGWMGQVHGAGEAEIGLQALEVRYKALARAIHNVLHVPWSEFDRVVLSAYPPLAIVEDGRSVCPDDRGGMSVWPDFKFIPEKALEGEQVSTRLQQLMELMAERYNFTFVDEHRRRFVGHGLCAGSSGDGPANAADDLRLPIKVDGVWKPFNPADYRPYASRQRWFRTPNDAYMTGNFHMYATVAKQLQKFQSLLWFQLLLASTYSGAFHPTAEGHAVMGDAVLVRARQILRNYRQ